MSHSSRVRLLAGVAAILGWLAVLLRLYLSLRNSLEDGTGIGGGLVEYLSYFTVLTNILVAWVLTANSRRTTGQSGLIAFFQRPGVNTAVAGYITVTALVYHVMLRQLRDPQGLAKVLDLMLHSVMPGLFLVFWWVGVPKAGLRWKFALGWLSYPLGYLIYTLILGAIRNKYPYPFVDVIELGYLRALRNSMGVFLVFLAVSLLLIGLGKWQAQRLKRSGTGWQK